MLQRISWGEFWTTILLLVALYYFALIVFFTRKGLFKNADSKGKIWSYQRTSAQSEQPRLFTQENEAGEQQGNDQAGDEILMPLVHDLVEEVKAYLISIARKSYIKEEIITGLQIIFKNYQKLDGSPYQKSINDFVALQCEDHCSTHLSADEIRRIWKG